MKINLYGKYADNKSKNIVERISKIKYLQGETIAIMPDNHFNGENAPLVGMTITTNNKKVIPNFVGGDIGCGITRIKINIDKDKVMSALGYIDNEIKKAIPTGITNRYQEQFEYITEEFKERINTLLNSMKVKTDDKQRAKIFGSVGTLGGGNHFIEINEDKSTQELFLTIHSGSRNFGQYVFKHYQALAQKKFIANNNPYTQELFKETIKEIDNHEKQAFVTDWNREKKEFENKHQLEKVFPYLEGGDYDDYMNDMALAQQFAYENRLLMCDIIFREFNKFLGVDININDSEIVNTFHNYVDKETGICRKGAVEAKIGKEFDIALNMKDGVIIAIGVENKDANQSAPHGAGRYMSRTEFKKTKADMKKTIKQMRGIFTTSINEFSIDESPDAYKPKEEIIEHLKGLATIKTIIEPIYSFKDAKEPHYMVIKKEKKNG